MGSVPYRFGRLSFALGVVGLSVTGCSRRGADADVAAVPVPALVRLAVLPDIDVLPVHVAQTTGLFAAHGCRVEMVSASSAVERDQLLLAGRVDALVTDLVALALYNQAGLRVVAGRYSRCTTRAMPQWRIVASRDSGIAVLSDLAGVEIGVSEGTVIDYVTWRLLAGAGVDPAQIRTVAVPSIAVRLELLREGRLRAATLPDSLAAAAIAAGAVAVTGDVDPSDFMCSVLAFRQAFLESEPDAVSGFLKAMAAAAAEINRDPEAWRTPAAAARLILVAVADTLLIPAYPVGGVPTEAQWRDVLDWLRLKRRLRAAIPYTAAIVDLSGQLAAGDDG